MCPHTEKHPSILLTTRRTRNPYHNVSSNYCFMSLSPTLLHDSKSPCFSCFKWIHIPPSPHQKTVAVVSRPTIVPSQILNKMCPFIFNNCSQQLFLKNVHHLACHGRAKKPGIFTKLNDMHIPTMAFVNLAALTLQKCSWEKIYLTLHVP